MEFFFYLCFVGDGDEKMFVLKAAKGVRMSFPFCFFFCVCFRKRVQAENLMFRAGKLIVKTLIRNMKKEQKNE